MATYYMPTDFADLATAVAGMSNTDTLIVEDGTYTGANNRNIDPGGKLITIQSENGPFACIFDMENADARFFYLHSGENNSFVIDGISFIRCGLAGTGYGGFASISGSSTAPIIKNCIVRNFGMGQSTTGIMFVWGGADPQLLNCLWYSNFVGGDAILINDGGTNVYIYNCTIVNTTGKAGVSCGVRAQGWGTARIYNSIIYNNQIYDTSLHQSTTWSYVYNTCYKTQYAVPKYSGNNTTSDPLHVVGPLGSYYLSQIAAGQGSDSPCVDTGDNAHTIPDWTSRTTRTDNVTDATTVDMGFHYDLPPPVADFSATPLSGDPPLTVQFTDESLYATSWLWDFGDGNTSTEQNPIHVYSDEGASYTVTLVATSASGSDTEIKTDYITTNELSCRTTHYRIPYYCGGEPSAARWKEGSQIIDTQLLGALTPFGSVLREGLYWSDESGTIVYSSGIEAFINHIYVAERGLMAWSGLSSGVDTWLYITLTENELYPGSREGAKLSTRFSTSYKSDWCNKDSICVAMRMADHSIDTEPPCKTYYISPGDHSNQHNPHGTKWFQDEVVSTKVTVIDLTVEQAIATYFEFTDPDIEFEFANIHALFSGAILNAKIDDVDVTNAYSSGTSFDVFSTGSLVGPKATLPGGELTDDLAVSSGVLVDHIDVDVFWSGYDQHLNDINPHQVTPEQANAVSVSGSTMIGDLVMVSGTTVDGEDVSELKPLIDGSVVDHLHYHGLLQPTEYIFIAPAFKGIVVDEKTRLVRDWYTGEHNVLSTRFDNTGGNAPVVNIKFGIPNGFRQARTLHVSSYVSRAECQPTFKIYDTANQLIANAILSGAGWHDYVLDVSQGQFTPGEFARIEHTFNYYAYSVAELGEIKMVYST